MYLQVLWWSTLTPCWGVCWGPSRQTWRGRLSPASASLRHNNSGSGHYRFVLPACLSIMERHQYCLAHFSCCSVLHNTSNTLLCAPHSVPCRSFSPRLPQDTKATQPSPHPHKVGGKNRRTSPTTHHYHCCHHHHHHHQHTIHRAQNYILFKAIKVLVVLFQSNK